MPFPPCEGCGAMYAEGSIGTSHSPDCPALRVRPSESEPTALEVRLHAIELALYAIARELKRHGPWWG
jgi:hypothetical protein